MWNGWKRFRALTVLVFAVDPIACKRAPRLEAKGKKDSTPQFRDVQVDVARRWTMDYRTTLNVSEAYNQA